MAALRSSYQILGRRSISQPSSTSSRLNAFSYSRLRSLQMMSSTARQTADKSRPSRHPIGNGENNNTELPPFDFALLGVTPRMRMFLIVLLCIFSTIETYTWSIFLYHHFYKDKKSDNSDDPEAWCVLYLSLELSIHISSQLSNRHCTIRKLQQAGHCNSQLYFQSTRNFLFFACHNSLTLRSKIYWGANMYQDILVFNKSNNRTRHMW
jgi:hypothetical protein